MKFRPIVLTSEQLQMAKGDRPALMELIEREVEEAYQAMLENFERQFPPETAAES